MISKKFIKSSFIYSVIGALPLASATILLPFYTNLLTTSQFGVLALYIAFTAIIQIIVNYSLDNYAIIHYIENKTNKDLIRNTIGTVVISLLIIGILMIAISLIFGNGLFKLYSSLTHNKTIIEFFPYGIMSVVTAVFNSFFKTYTNLLIAQQRPNRFFWMNIFNFVLTISISLAGLYMFPETLTGPMWGRLLSGLGIFLMALFFFIREFGIGFRGKLVKGMLKYCSPLLLYLILFWIIGNIDRYIIGYFLPSEKIGIFDFAIKCTLLLEFFQNGLTSAINPKIYNIWSDNKTPRNTPEINRYYNGFTVVTLICLPVFILVLPYLIPLIVKNKDYFISFNSLAVLAMGYAITGLRTMYQLPVLYFKKTGILPRVYSYSAVIQVAATVIAVRYMGLMGAVWVNFLIKLLQVLFLHLETRKTFTLEFNRVKLLYLPLFFCLITVVFYFAIKLFSLNYLFWGIHLCIVYISVYMVFRKEVRLLLKDFSFKSMF
jgi:O-antigen/teichoic acid export membrane protein